MATATPGPAEARPIPRAQLSILNEDIVNVRSEAEFQREVTESRKLVLIHYHNNDCRTCDRVDTLLEDFVLAHPGRVKVARVNLDEQQYEGMERNLKLLPVVMAAKNGGPDPAANAPLRSRLSHARWKCRTSSTKPARSNWVAYAGTTA